jgi:hypothetical protein
MQGQSLTTYLITGIVVVLVLALRFRRLGKARPLRLEQLWVVPAIYLVAVAITLAETPPDGTGVVWGAGALIIGGAIGWWRGRSVRIMVDPQTHALNQTASPATMILLVALIGLRFGFRAVLGQEAANWHVSSAAILDAFLLLALGLLAVQRLEMFLRGRRLLAAARAV